MLPRGRPRVFIAHGNADRVLTVPRFSRRVVPMLQGAGCEVRYLEVDGGHEVPPKVAKVTVEEVTA